MSKFIKDYLIPISTVPIDGVLGYLTNNLPSVRPEPEKGITGLSDTSKVFLYLAQMV